MLSCRKWFVQNMCAEDMTRELGILTNIYTVYVVNTYTGSGGLVRGLWVVVLVVVVLTVVTLVVCLSGSTINSGWLFSSSGKESGSFSYQTGWPFSTTTWYIWPVSKKINQPIISFIIRNLEFGCIGTLNWW